MTSALKALECLRKGNRRFITDTRSESVSTGQARRSDLKEGQAPFAVILGCSDSRVPVELVFDQGLGDLFVIRVAGNVVAPSVVGSVEYAADLLGTRLVVVLGHSGCGAVRAALNEVERPSGRHSPNLGAIVDSVRLAVEPLFENKTLVQDREVLMRYAVRDNIRASAEHLRHGSPVLKGLIQQAGLVVVSAEYSLATGVVDFFDGLPAES